MDALGRLDRADAVLGEGDQRRGVEDGAGCRLDRDLDPLAPFLVGNTEDHALIDVGMLGQGRLDVGRIDVETARDDDVAQPVLDRHIAVCVHDPGIARVQPAVDHGLRGLLRHVEIAAHHQVAAAHDLSHLARRQHRAVGGHDRHLGEHRRPSDRAVACRIGELAGGHRGDHHRRLGLAVDDLERAVEDRARLGDAFRRHRRRAVLKMAQVAEVAVAHPGFGEQIVNQRRRQKGGGRAADLEGVEDRRRLGRGQEDVASADREDRQDIVGRAMGQRRRAQIDVVAVEAEGAKVRGNRGVDAAIGLDDALWAAGRAAGELDRLGRIKGQIVSPRPLALGACDQCRHRLAAAAGDRRRAIPADDQRHLGKGQSVEAIGVGDHRVERRRGDDGIELGAPVAGIERDPDMTGGVDREHRDDMFDGVEGADADACLGFGIARLQGVRQGIDLGHQGAVVHAAAAVVEGDAGRIAAGTAIEVVDRIHVPVRGRRRGADAVGGPV